MKISNNSRLFDDSRNDESSTAHSFRRSVYGCSVDFPQSRIAFALALSCHLEMQNAVVCNCERCIRSLEERRFSNVAYVTTYMKALLEGERKRRNPFAGRTTRQCSTHFSFPHYHRRMASEQINRMEYVETKERRGRDSKSKRSIKSCRCVSRAQQRGRCQKRLSSPPGFYKGSSEERRREDGKPFRSSAES